MINIETLLSSFDERGTLLKWLKAVEKALNEATLTSVDVITISTQQIQLQFNFEDGTHLTTPTITLPKGDKGDTGATGQTGETGATGVGVSNVTVNASNHLIVTLTDETEIDAGEINVTSGVVIDTSMSASSENPVQNKVIYTALAGKQDVIDATHKLSADNVDDSATTNKFVTSSEKSTWNSKQDVIDATHKLSADNVDDSNTTNKFVTSAEKSTWNGKQNALTTTSVPDGTIDDAIGFDSQGNVVKGSAGGSGGATIDGGFNVTFEDVTASISIFGEVEEYNHNKYFGWHYSIRDFFSATHCFAVTLQGNNACQLRSGTAYYTDGTQVPLNTNIPQHKLIILASDCYFYDND